MKLSLSEPSIPPWSLDATKGKVLTLYQLHKIEWLLINGYAFYVKLKTNPWITSSFTMLGQEFLLLRLLLLFIWFILSDRLYGKKIHLGQYDFFVRKKGMKK